MHVFLLILSLSSLCAHYQRCCRHAIGRNRAAGNLPVTLCYTPAVLAISARWLRWGQDKAYCALSGHINDLLKSLLVQDFDGGQCGSDL
jgi:hypothetical protein